MNDARIAIPSTLPGGLEAEVGAHFGHCDLYTIVDVKNGQITTVSTPAQCAPPARRLPGTREPSRPERRNPAHRWRHGNASPDGLQRGRYRSLPWHGSS